ncbi:MAG TPA: hypothetical protein VLE99_05305 [Candidatus Saccharimonadales bacterium]|nr:hypothetical protein [Candidatus Saccharimonadales bacterium]
MTGPTPEGANDGQPDGFLWFVAPDSSAYLERAREAGWPVPLASEESEARDRLLDSGDMPTALHLERLGVIETMLAGYADGTIADDEAWRERLVAERTAIRLGLLAAEIDEALGVVDAHPLAAGGTLEAAIAASAQTETEPEPAPAPDPDRAIARLQSILLQLATGTLEPQSYREATSLIGQVPVGTLGCLGLITSLAPQGDCSQAALEGLDHCKGHLLYALQYTTSADGQPIRRDYA